MLIKKRVTWTSIDLKIVANGWVKKIRRKNLKLYYKSVWWNYIFNYSKIFNKSIDDFIHELFQFSPMVVCYSFEKANTILAYKDRLILKFLSKIIQPAINRLISDNCYHLNGPSGIKKAINYIKASLETTNYRYFIRTYVKDYYASISRDILTKQILDHFNVTDFKLNNFDVLPISMQFNFLRFFVFRTFRGLSLQGSALIARCYLTSVFLGGFDNGISHRKP